MNLSLAQQRLFKQRLVEPVFTKPEQVVGWLGAMQAQDYLGSLWSVGQRIKNAAEADIEKALAKKKIVRTWPMRGTLHFVLPENARWMQRLLGPRVIAKAQSNYRTEGLDKATFSKSRKLLENALRGQQQLTRDELYEALERGKIKLGGQRGIHLVTNAAIEQLICMGPRQGKQHTFVLMDEWIPVSKELTGDEALLELARMYFKGHSPATVADFSWWTGLTLTEARRAIDIAGTELKSVKAESQTYFLDKAAVKETTPSPHVALLSWFDEYIIAYKDRSAAFDPATKKFITNPKNGIYTPVILIDGKIAGNWKRTLEKNDVSIEIKLFRSFSPQEKKALEVQVERYKSFLQST